jgi:hypothetical protein
MFTFASKYERTYRFRNYAEAEKFADLFKGKMTSSYVPGLYFVYL